MNQDQAGAAAKAPGPGLVLWRRTKTGRGGGVRGLCYTVRAPRITWNSLLPVPGPLVPPRLVFPWPASGAGWGRVPGSIRHAKLAELKRA